VEIADTAKPFAVCLEKDSNGKDILMDIRRRDARISINVVKSLESWERKSKEMKPPPQLHWKYNKPDARQFATSYHGVKLREFEAKFYKAAAWVPVHFRQLSDSKGPQACILLGLEQRDGEEATLHFLGGKREDKDDNSVGAHLTTQLTIYFRRLAF